jgi:hypothetical protein
MAKTSNDNGKKIMIYGGNFLFPSLVKFLGSHSKISINPNIANPYGAAIFGALDVLGEVSDKIKNHWFTGLSKAAGFGWYGIATASDLMSIAGGKYENFANLPFDASMAYQLGRDTFSSYTGKKLMADITSAVKAARAIPGKIDGLQKKISKLR